MKQEFVTLYGKAIIEREILFLRSYYLPFEKTAFVQIGIEILWLGSLILRIFTIDSDMDIIVTIVWALVVLSRAQSMYDKFFMHSYANRIPLRSIQHITIIEDEPGIQTSLKLHLKNGRYKCILFRNLEGEAGRFLNALSGYPISAAEPATNH